MSHRSVHYDIFSQVIEIHDLNSGKASKSGENYFHWFSSWGWPGERWPANMTTISVQRRQCRGRSFGKAWTEKKLETAVTRNTWSYFFQIQTSRIAIQTRRRSPLVIWFPIFALTIMAVLVCQVCDLRRVLWPFQPGRIVEEGPWTFDPETGCCLINKTRVAHMPALTCTTIISAGECYISLF